MNISELRKPLRIDEIDFRVQSLFGYGEKVSAVVLAYKDARVDINRLDQVVGPLGWTRSHSRDNHNCTVSIWDSEHQHWVSKEDTGTESNTEAQKGLASDSFKRACFNWGIGIELYDYPFICIELNKDEYKEYQGKYKATSKLLRNWAWYSELSPSGKVIELAAKDTTGKVRFKYQDKTHLFKRGEMQQVVDQVLEAINNGDASHLKEVWTDYDADQQAALSREFNNRERQAIRELLNAS